MFDRVLGGDNHEGVRQDQRSPVDGHLAIVHRLQESRLSFWSGAVDFVREKKIGENRPRFELEGFRMRVIDGDADDVTREHVRGELEPMEFTLYRPGYSM